MNLDEVGSNAVGNTGRATNGRIKDAIAFQALMIVACPVQSSGPFGAGHTRSTVTIMRHARVRGMGWVLELWFGASTNERRACRRWSSLGV